MWSRAGRAGQSGARALFCLQIPRLLASNLPRLEAHVLQSTLLQHSVYRIFGHPSSAATTSLLFLARVCCRYPDVLAALDIPRPN